jgi:hypothetical protein
MRILADSNITDATITATNITAASTDKLKTFQLSDNLRTITNSTVIDLVYDPTEPPVNCVALCGTNLTSSAVITLSWSDTDISTPDDSEVFPTFSSLNQVIFLAASIQKKYIRISITDSTLSTLFIGFLYIGVYHQVTAVEFGQIAALEMFSNPAVSPTGQGYGSKVYNALPVDFTMFVEYDELEDYLTIKQEKQNIDPVLMVEYEDDYDLTLYRPKYGVLSLSSIPYQMDGTPEYYTISDRLEERF